MKNLIRYNFSFILINSQMIKSDKRETKNCAWKQNQGKILHLNSCPNRVQSCPFWLVRLIYPFIKELYLSKYLSKV